MPTPVQANNVQVNKNINQNALTDRMREEIQRWHLQAKEELSTAHICSQGKKWFAVAFWCQQAVEKSLKAVFMIQKKASPGVTHSLTFLGREVKTPVMFSDLLRSLTKEYFFSRYPDASEDVPYKAYSKSDAILYLRGTEELLKWSDSQLKKH